MAVTSKAMKYDGPSYYVPSDRGTALVAPTAPTAPTYLTNTMAKPTYSSPTAGAQYSGYNTERPTWEWDDSARPGDWNWDEAKPTYTNQYQDQINGMVDAILNREKFSYDYNTDPLYKMYADAYTRNGRQAMKDTYAQAAARTGGLGSSYANTAAQSQYNQYMNALNDKVPELYKLAYSMYQDEGNTMRNNLGMIQGLESTDYGRYQDALGQWNTDRNFSYGQYQDLWDRYYNDRDFSYGTYQDALGQYNTDRSWDYNLWQDNLSRQEAAAQNAYSRALAAYNAEQNRIDQINASRTAQYKSDLDAYDSAMRNYNSAQSKTSVSAGANGYQWNGKNYTSVAQLREAINATDLTDSEWNSLKKSLQKNNIL